MKTRVRKKDREIWNKAEKEAWRLPKEITVSDWANENRELSPLTSAEHGRWRTDRTPHLKGIMDAFNDPFVEEITVMASTQVGKTEALYNMLGYIIDQDPAPTLLVMPRVPDARSVSQNRIKPMLELSPALKTHLPTLEDDITNLEYHLDRMIVYFAGSNSPADLSGRPIRYLFLDEIDKFPKFSGKEADPISLATERTRTFWNRKIIKVSTPTTRQGYIFREYEKSDRRRYYVPCPYCGKYQILIFSPQLKYPKAERNAEKIRTERLAWYECQYCGKKITENMKSRMISQGVWAPDGAEITPKGQIKGNIVQSRHAGFWLSALYSPWLSWSDIAAKFLTSQSYNELMNFVNSWLAEIWEEKGGETKPQKLAALAGIYPEGKVPSGGLVLTGGVDVQKDYFILVIRAWGIGEESWLVRACRVESWEEVISILFMTNYSREKGGTPLPVRLTNIDSGYRTAEVYEVCRKWRDVARPVKGQNHLPGAPYRVSIIDRHPETGLAVPGGLALWHIDTSHFKDKMNRMVHAEPGDPAQWHLFENPSDDYLNQFCAEHKVIIRDRKTGRTKEEWRVISTGAPNHYLDAENYAVAAADMIRVSAMRKEQETTTYQPRETSGFIKRSQSSWLGHRGSEWLRRG